MNKLKQFIGKNDKLLHFIAGIIIALGAWYLVKKTGYIVEYLPVLAAFTIGFVKEWIDEWRGRLFNWKDFLATLAGGGLTNLILYYARCTN